jgi:hypothetical protein
LNYAIKREICLHPAGVVKADLNGATVNLRVNEMKELLDGLLLYEITLLMLGVFLFLILSIGLLYYIIKKEQIAKLLFFFFIPIVMIGYPSITQITRSNN